ncbi:MAG: hypothetical protein ABL898_05720 [Hyphomicrobiaceae bacterium]|nr:hypothetical protein [Hyphomicrobiaceae bacterium]
MTAHQAETQIQSQPLTSWIFAAVTSAITLVYLVSIGTRTTTISANEVLVPVLIVPALIGCIIWLATRPAYTVTINRKTNRLSAAEIWPEQKLLHEVALTNVAAIAVQVIEGNDSDTYRTVIVTKTGSNVPVTSELASKGSAERFAKNLRAELAL